MSDRDRALQECIRTQAFLMEMARTGEGDEDALFTRAVANELRAEELGLFDVQPDATWAVDVAKARREATPKGSPQLPIMESRVIWPATLSGNESLVTHDRDSAGVWWERRGGVPVRRLESEEVTNDR